MMQGSWLPTQSLKVKDVAPMNISTNVLGKMVKNHILFLSLGHC
jgi:hypothetical protein